MIEQEQQSTTQPQGKSIDLCKGRMKKNLNYSSPKSEKSPISLFILDCKNNMIDTK